MLNNVFVNMQNSFFSTASLKALLAGSVRVRRGRGKFELILCIVISYCHRAHDAPSQLCQGVPSPQLVSELISVTVTRWSENGGHQNLKEPW